LKRIGGTLFSTRLAFRGYGVACFNQGYPSSSDSFFSFLRTSLVGVFLFCEAYLLRSVMLFFYEQAHLFRLGPLGRLKDRKD